MLGDKMLDSLNDQVKWEFYSSYLYVQMAAWFEAQNLPGSANWMKMQAQEEACHAMILFNYVCERGGMVTLGAIEQPPSKYGTPAEVFQKTLEHEQVVTGRINALVDLAIDERDHATKNRLEWFVSEQVEEEASATEVLGKLTLIGDDSNGIFILDKELAARVFTMPAPLAGG